MAEIVDLPMKNGDFPKLVYQRVSGNLQKQIEELQNAFSISRTRIEMVIYCSTAQTVSKITQLVGVLFQLLGVVTSCIPIKITPKIRKNRCGCLVFPMVFIMALLIKQGEPLNLIINNRVPIKKKSEVYNVGAPSYKLVYKPQ